MSEFYSSSHFGKDTAEEVWIVIPVETGIHSGIASFDWIPACAGMDGVNTRCLYVLMKKATAIKEDLIELQIP